MIRRLGLEHHAGVRLDSGDLAQLAFDTRRLLDASRPDRGAHLRLRRTGRARPGPLRRPGAPIDAAGVGTRMGVSADVPYLDSAYKLVAYDGRPVAKLSTAKATLPGPKQVFRSHGVTDWIGLRDEPGPPDAERLLQPAIRGGHRVRLTEPLGAARARFEADLDQLPRSAQDLDHPSGPAAEDHPALQTLTTQVQAGARRRQDRATPVARYPARVTDAQLTT